MKDLKSIPLKSEELDNNDYIKLAIKLYNASLNDKNHTTQEVETAKPKKKLFGKSKVEEETHIKSEKELVWEDINQYLKYISDPDSNITFKDLWKYCQFIRWAEKAVFYHNDLTKNIICDSPMYSDGTANDKRILYIQSSDIIINIELSIVKVQTVSSILDVDNLEDRLFDYIIQLDIKRKYGKLMNNKVIVLNQDFQLKDSSDKYMLLSVYSIIKKVIHDNLLYIMNWIEHQEFLDDF